MSLNSVFSVMGLFAMIGAMGAMTDMNVGQAATDDSGNFWRGGPCAASVEGICKEFELAPAEVLKCLYLHRSNLTPECRKEVSSLELDQEGVPERCRADVVEHCAKTMPGENRMLNCLNKKRLQLAPGCRVALENLADGKKK